MSKRKTSGTGSKFRSKLAQMWTDNPVLANGLTLAPVVVASVYLKNAVAISIAMFIVTIPTLFVASIIKSSVPNWRRVPIYAVVSGVFYVGAAFLIKLILPTALETAGIYLPLMITNTIIMMRAENFAVKNKTGWVLLDGVVQVVGYSFVICLIALFREYFSNSTVWGTTVHNPFPIAGLSLPFAGFIILGLVVALYQLINNRARAKREEMDELIGTDEQ